MRRAREKRCRFNREITVNRFAFLTLACVAAVPCSLVGQQRQASASIDLHGSARALAHLFANGDDRSLVLFGGLGLWAIVEILMISRREGAWQRPGAGSFRANAVTVVLGLVAYVVIMIVHPYLFGVSPLPSS